MLSEDLNTLKAKGLAVDGWREALFTAMAWTNDQVKGRKERVREGGDHFLPPFLFLL